MGDHRGVGMAYRFELVSSEGEILETFETSEQRWQAGDTFPLGPDGCSDSTAAQKQVGGAALKPPHPLHACH
jgi:hypothetical protein